VKWLLDTNVVSETVKSRSNKRVLNWLAARVPTETGISIVTVAELRMGARTTASLARRRELTEWIEQQIETPFAERTLPLTTDILVEWLVLGRRNSAVGKTRAPADLLIAATARVHDLIVVTRNAKDFAGTGVLLYDPWDDKSHQMELA
jgi:toxin FitB